jgi:alpha-ketoglutarate-dependent taurine dioxygenase
VLAHGAVLIRSAGIRSAADLAAGRAALGLAAADCPDRFSHRTDHGDGVYSWPEWAADRDMCLHHEQSQGATFPRVLLLGCLAVPEQGGSILLGDTRAVVKHIPSDLSQRFGAGGWSLRRTFRPRLGVPWSAAFGVADRAELERRLAEQDVSVSWTADGTLRTEQTRPAVVDHPVTGEACWFNDVAFFSRWSVPELERSVLISAFGPDGLPLDTTPGAGAPLTEAEYDILMDAYAEASTKVDWRPGDLLLVDNMLTAHGREPHSGGFDVLVAMASPTTR